MGGQTHNIGSFFNRLEHHMLKLSDLFSCFVAIHDWHRDVHEYQIKSFNTFTTRVFIKSPSDYIECLFTMVRLSKLYKFNECLQLSTLCQVKHPKLSTTKIY